MAHKSKWQTALTRRPDPLSSLVLTIPVFLTYHLGILLIDFRNGVDLVTGLTFRLLESSVLAYVATTLAFAAVLSLLVWFQRRRGHVRPATLGSVLFESAFWALLMMLSVGWGTAQLRAALTTPLAAGLGVAPALGPTPLAAGLGVAPALGPLDKLVMAAGAGFHEEVVFRVMLLSGTRGLLVRMLGAAPRPGLAIGLVSSSILFALAHHLGPVADPIDLWTLTFRSLAGLYLGALYLVRGFAVAVYTHTLYDILVFFLF